MFIQGWNDVGYRSTYLNWTTPTIDRLASEGVKFENYFTYSTCIPSRGALLTGRYPIRLGLLDAFGSKELPLSEVTIGQELQSAGYQTYMVGKWHLGFSTLEHTPANRGFQSSYTYWNGFVDYWTKGYGIYNDLHDGIESVTNEDELSTDLHNGILMQTKAEKMIVDHVQNYPNKPMFLYYAMQLIHGMWSAPQQYLDRCGEPSTITDEYTRNVTYNYCALNVMLDEAIANLTCALETNGMADNTILVIVSDNGGEATVNGNSYPFKGNKGSLYRGGLSGTGFIHSKLLPETAQGHHYHGQMHVTDWLPTLMGLATNNEWTGSYINSTLDGVDQWTAMTTPHAKSPRKEIVHFHDGLNTSCIQIDMIKLNIGDDLTNMGKPDFVFKSDLHPEYNSQKCENPSLINTETTFFDTKIISTTMELNDLSKTILPKTTETNTETNNLNKSMIIVMICLLASLVLLMSVRLAHLMGKSENDYIHSLSASDNRKEKYDDGRNNNETTKLLP